MIVEPKDATIETNIERYKKKGNEFILKKSSVGKVIELL